MVGAGTACSGDPDPPSAATRLVPGEPYQDPTLPIAARVADLLARMSLDEKLGQMTQAERGAVSQRARSPVPARLAAVRRRLGAVAQQRRPRWADMYDGFQNAALATPLRHPDDLRRGRGARAQQRARGDDLPAQHRARRDPRPRPGAADRPGDRRGGRRHRGRLGLRAVPVRGPQRPLGAYLRVVRREAGARHVDDHHHHRAAGRHARRPGLGPRHGQALHRRRRHDQRHRPGQHPAQRGGAAGDPPAAVPGRRAARRRLGHGLVQQLERRQGCTATST